MNKQIKVLIVEDEMIIGMNIKIQLRTKGFIANRIVATGKKAIEAVKREKPDVILMDIRLAGSIDGIEAVKQIWEIKKIPVIFMTGYPDENIKHKVMELNPLGLFIKPVNISAIIKTINEKFNIGED